MQRAFSTSTLSSKTIRHNRPPVTNTTTHQTRRRTDPSDPNNGSAPTSTMFLLPGNHTAPSPGIQSQTTIGLSLSFFPRPFPDFPCQPHY